MISYEDCAALCGLTKAEVAAIAEHEHVPDIAAATLAQYLLNQKHGPEKISRMIAEDVRAALDGGDVRHAAALMAALRHFWHFHPQAISGRGADGKA